MTEKQILEKKKMEGQPPTKRTRRLMEENIVIEDKENYSAACLIELSTDNTVEKLRYNAKTMLSKYISDFEWHIVNFDVVGFINEFCECPHPSRARSVRILSLNDSVLGNVAELLDEQICNLVKDYCFSIHQVNQSKKSFKCLLGVAKDQVKMMDIFDDKRFSLTSSTKIPDDDYVHALLSILKVSSLLGGLFVSPIGGIQDIILKITKMIFNYRIAYNERNLPDFRHVGCLSAIIAPY